ncbi:hypothetical protein ACLBXM_18905 [Xanthobacteraceae bacterium A53D]
MAELSPAERRQNLGAHIAQLIELRKAERNPVVRSRLGQQISRLQHEMGRMPKPANRPDVTQCFIDIAKQMLAPGQFKAMMAAAERLHEEREAEAGKRKGGMI